MKLREYIRATIDVASFAMVCMAIVWAYIDREYVKASFFLLVVVSFAVLDIRGEVRKRNE